MVLMSISPVDGCERDVYRFTPMKLLKLLLTIPHMIAATATIRAGVVRLAGVAGAATKSPAPRELCWFAARKLQNRTEVLTTHGTSPLSKSGNDHGGHK